MSSSHHDRQRGTRPVLAVLAGLALSTSAAAQSPGAAEGANSEDLTETIPPSGEDTVETIGPQEPAGAPDAEAQPAADAQSAGGDTHVQLSGYARQSLELVYGELSRRGRSTSEIANCPEAPCLWRDVFLSHTQLALRASYVQKRHFEATVSGMLGYTLHVAEQAPAYSNGVVDLTRGELDPQLREAYVGFFWPSVDLRIGQQRVAWGRADFQSPNDVVNARDLRNPFLSENELRYLPTPVIRSSVNAGTFVLEGVLAPFFVPDRFDVYGTNWSAIQRHAPSQYQEFLGATSLQVDPSIEREFAELWRQTERPLDNGKGISAGLKMAVNLPGVDLSGYYHYGFDSTPYVVLADDFLTYLRDTNFMPANAAKLKPVLDLIDQLRDRGGPIWARYLRRHHAGLDLATVLGPVVLRLDAAYESRRVFYRVDFNSFATPAVLGVASLEYQTGSLDNVVLLEFLAQHMLDPLPEVVNAEGMLVSMPLLAYDRTTTALAGTLRWTLGDSWGVDLRGLVGIHPQTYVLQPALRYKPNDSWTVRLGALVLSGETTSFGWYYGDNDTAFVQVRYAF